MVEPASSAFLDFPVEDAFGVDLLSGFVLAIPLDVFAFPEDFVLIDKSMSAASFSSLPMF